MGSENDRVGMARYGFKVDRAFGVSVYECPPSCSSYDQHGNRCPVAHRIDGLSPQ